MAVITVMQPSMPNSERVTQSRTLDPKSLRIRLKLFSNTLRYDHVETPTEANRETPLLLRNHVGSHTVKDENVFIWFDRIFRKMRPNYCRHVLVANVSQPFVVQARCSLSPRISVLERLNDHRVHGPRRHHLVRRVLLHFHCVDTDGLLLLLLHSIGCHDRHPVRLDSDDSRVFPQSFDRYPK